jgi:putative toxin-antitoxin system antitoxin component (TIGR02293 family)
MTKRFQRIDRPELLERVAAKAEQAFGDATKANRWLNKPKHELDGQTPLACLATEAGARKVEEMLVRIEHGIFA